MSRSFVLLFTLGLGTCGGPPGVIVEVDNWPTEAERLSVVGELDGVQYMDPLSFVERSRRIVVYVPEGASGQLSLKLTAFDNEDCPLSAAETQVEVGRGLRRIVETAVTMTSLPGLRCPAPRLLRISPPSGVNNTATPLTLTGSGFRAGAEVIVGDKPCTAVQVRSKTELTCVAPGRPGSCGPQSVVVKNRDGQPSQPSQPSSKSQFSYRSAVLQFEMAKVFSSPGSAQRQIVATDFNGDGRLDVASACFGSNDVKVFLNKGMGLFENAKSFGTGAGPVGLAAADLNQDGKLDLVTANAADDSISFLAGDGKGSFLPAVPTRGLTAPQGVVIADISGDGVLDVLVTHNNKVGVFTGKGDGGLVSQMSVLVGGSARYLSLGDMNGDGLLDLVVPNVGPDTISYRPGKSMAGFETGYDLVDKVGNNPVQTVVADLNHDQRLDIIVASQDSSSVSVFLADGNTYTPTAASPISVSQGPSGLTVVDIDGDGELDIVTASLNGGGADIRLGNGNGEFRSVAGNPFLSAIGPFAIATGDFNGDGLLDFATAQAVTDSTAIVLAKCQ